MGLCSAISRISGILVSVLGGSMIKHSVDLALMSYAAAYLSCAACIFALGVDMTGIPLSGAVREIDAIQPEQKEGQEIPLKGFDHETL